MKPSLFEYATSELSQDAFLAWLFRWAAEENKSVCSVLHHCAEYCLRKFFGSIELGRIEKVDVWKQWDCIDLWIAVNETYHLIIEDKVHTMEHDNQLRKYKESARQWNQDNGGTSKDFENNYAFVYFKTGKVLESEKSVADREGWTVIDGNFFYESLALYENIDNDIFQDYKFHLKTLLENQTDVRNLKYDTLLQAHDRNLKKLYRLLQGYLYKDAAIDRQTNQLKWYYCGIPTVGNVYLVLKKTDLYIVLKLNNSRKLSIPIINKFQDEFSRYSLEDNFVGSNTYELCRIPGEEWIAKDGDDWNLEKTIENLHSVEDRLWVKVLENTKWN